MKACILVLIAVTLSATVDAQSGTTGMACPMFNIIGTYTLSTATVGSAANYGMTSSTKINCPICVQGTIGGTVVDNTGASAVTYNLAGTAYFCAASCPSASSVAITYTSGSVLSVTGVNLHPASYNSLVSAYDVPTTDYDLSWTISSMTCFGAGWKLSASPIVLLAVVVAGFFMRKN